MFGSVDRLKAVVEIVGREVVRELRKNPIFSTDLIWFYLS